MSEPTEKDQNEIIIEETIENWRKGLPGKLHGRYLGKDEITTPEEMFQHYDKTLEKLSENSEKNRKENEKLLAGIKENKRDVAINLSMWFYPESAKNAVNGDVSDGFGGNKPFYVNARFNNAWNRMCEQFPNEVGKIIEYSIRRSAIAEETKEPKEKTGKIEKNTRMTEEENSALNNLALYLSETEGINISFICH